MPSTSSANLNSLRRWASRLKTQAAPAAVRAGQAVIAAGLARRAPARLRGSIQVRQVGQAPGFVGGFVVVNHPAARRLEARRPFVGPTSEDDGPKAAEAMVEVLRRSLR